MLVIINTPVDTTPPVCRPTTPATGTTSLNGPGTTVTFTEPDANDNSGQVNLRSRTHSPGQFFPVGLTEVCYTFADPSQNTVDCCLNVNVIEGECFRHPVFVFNLPVRIYFVVKI